MASGAVEEQESQLAIPAGVHAQGPSPLSQRLATSHIFLL